MKVIKSGRHWIIEIPWHSMPSIVACRSDRLRDQHGEADYRWTGTDWAAKRAFAKQFETKSDAQKYMADNFQILSDAIAVL